MSDYSLPSPAPPSSPLYHYTTMNALMEIVKHRTIWATNISYLNDYTEGEHFLDLVRARLPRLLKKYGLSDYALQMLESRDEVTGRPFIASCTRQRSSLPQWRSYCPNGNGVAMGFCTECLTNALLYRARDSPSPSRRDLVGLKQVLYAVEAENDAEIDASIQKIVDETNEYMNLNRNIDPNDVPREMIFSFLAKSEASRRKHESFAHECEYRLIVDPYSVGSQDLEFRTVRSTLVPYVQVSIPQRPPGARVSLYEGRTTDYLAEVVVGPTSNTELSIQAIRSLLDKFDMGHVPVRSAGIPYREW